MDFLIMILKNRAMEFLAKRPWCEDINLGGNIESLQAFSEADKRFEVCHDLCC